MYELRPPSIVVFQDVLDDPAMAPVYERLRAAVPADTPVHIVTDDTLPDLVAEQDWPQKCVRMGMPPPAEDPILVVGKMRWDGKWPELQERLKAQAPNVPLSMFHKLYGYDAFSYASFCTDGKTSPKAFGMCRPAWRLHLSWGCPHKCFYCGCTGAMTAMANLDEYRAKLAELVEKNPWELCWLYDDDAEALALEPEYGGMKMLVEYFGTTPDRYLTVHTKSANVDFLEDLDHRGHTILTWSLTGATQSTLMEAQSGSMVERIEAAAKTQQWGYTPRFKFKPIVPVLNWRDELAEMIKLVFERTRPDNITLFTLAWMVYPDLIKLADTSLLDPWALGEAEKAAEEMATSRVGPFPHHVRKAIYEFALDEIHRYDKEVPVALSTESLEMWRDLGPRLGVDPTNYVCGCGPTAIPGLRKLPADPFKAAQPVGLDS
ncbi:MAG: spore photoproduct lyase family protein [Armatimonadia bacterium]